MNPLTGEVLGAVKTEFDRWVRVNTDRDVVDDIPENEAVGSSLGSLESNTSANSHGSNRLVQGRKVSTGRRPPGDHHSPLW